MMASVWATLGLAPGSDRDDIRRAYARRLRVTHPEDDPDGFKALREAYELALRYHEDAVYRALAESEDASEEEPGAEFEPIESAASYGTWTAPPPLPERNSGAADEQDKADADRLEDLLQRFAMLLANENGCDQDEARSVFEAIVASPAQAQIAAAEHSERWLAYHIARSIPRSDFIIDRAVSHFRWFDLDIARPLDPAVGDILGRVDEWQFIHWASAPGSPVELGWAALTNIPATGARMRLEGLSSARCNQVEAIFGTAQSTMPGLHFHFHPERLEWWRRHLSRARMTFETLLLAPLIVYLAFIGTMLMTRQSWNPAVIAVACAVAAATPVLYLRFVRQPHYERQVGDRPPLPRWIELGWVALAALLPLAALPLPPTPLGAASVAVAAIALAAWTAFAVPSRRSTTGLGRRAWAGALGSWHVAVPLLIGISSLPKAYEFHGFAVACAILFVWFRGQDILLWLAETRVPRGRLAIGVALVLAAAGGAALAIDQLQQEPRQYVAVIVAIWCLPILLALWRLSPESNKFALVVCGVALLVLWGYAQPPERFRQPDPEPVSRYVEPPDLLRIPPPESEMPATVRVAPPARQPDCTEPGADPVNCVWPERDGRSASRVPPEPPPPVIRCPPDRQAGGPLPPRACAAGSWFVESDYPAEMLRAGLGGTTRATLEIGADGRVASCRILRSSGAATLDRTTCRILEDRGRFHPARDEDGRTVSGRVNFDMEWQAPN